VGPEVRIADGRVDGRRGFILAKTGSDVLDVGGGEGLLLLLLLTFVWELSRLGSRLAVSSVGVRVARRSVGSRRGDARRLRIDGGAEGGRVARLLSLTLETIDRRVGVVKGGETCGALTARSGRVERGEGSTGLLRG
jgi:hypothetical protein